MSTQEKVPTILELVARIDALTKEIEELKSKSKGNASEREMTDEDARRILTGDLKDTKHKDAADQLKLSYGQVYSCRLEYTFKAVHKELANAGFKNPWIKK